MDEDLEFELLHDGEYFHGYRISRVLGRGGIGAVYLAKHEALDTFYAIKILSPSVAEEDDMQVKRFLREARLAARIRHPNLVAVHDCGYDEQRGVYYLVMDYVTGSSLRTVLAMEGTLSLARAANIVAQVAMALKASQAFNVVHRDIKPENIMIQPDGLVKLLDLGIAKAQNLGDSVRTTTDNFFGTPAYISPEQAEDSANVDSRADIYSLGIVFFEMLTGKCPYSGRTAAEILMQIVSDEPTPDIRDVQPGMSVDAAILIRQMTVKDLDRRMSSFDEILDGLAKIGCEKMIPINVPAEVATKPEVGMKTLLDRVTDNSDKTPPKRSKGLFRRICEGLGW